jgi:tetratricopeptide (TPR) repeat protein
MSSLFFWNSWFREYRIIWYVLFAIFLLSMLYMWYGYFFGLESVISWENLQEQKVINTTVHTFRIGPFVLNVPAESYVILEYLQGSHTAPNTTASYIFLVIISLAMTVLISVITTLDRLWFYVAVALFSIFVFTLRIEVVGVFGLYAKIAGMAAIALYLAPAFYFNSIRPATPFVIRLLVFTCVTITLGLLIGLFSRENIPFYHLVLTSFSGTMVLSLIFLILIAHEIFAGFVYLASQGSAKSMQHLAILSTIYFINLLLTLINELNIVSFDFVFLNVFLLLTISALLGIWGFRSRESVYGNIFVFNPFGGYLFLSLGMICFATIGHQLLNANDPGVHIARHAILFTQCGYGLIFLLYLLSNFGQMLSENKPVYKVLYTPHRMPYFTFRLAGFIATLSIFIYGGWRSYVYDGVGAFHITAGDFHSLLGDVSSQAFYERASRSAFHNHRSNYTLGMLNASGYDFEDAHRFMNAANGRRPTEYSLANGGILYIREGLSREAIAEYRKRLKEFPDDPAILNNIAVSYINLRNVDSALYFLSKARESGLTKTQAETNFFGMAAMETIPIDADSVYKAFNNPSTALLSNMYALSGVLNTEFTSTEDPLKEPQLSLYTATYLNNYILRNAKTLDTAFTGKAFRIASDPANSDFSEALKSALAYAYYHQGNITKALEILAEQVYLSQDYRGKYNYIMGLWALEQNNAARAAEYFAFADTQQFEDAPFYHAIALSEAGNLQSALAAWDSVELRSDLAQRDIAANMKKTLTMSPAEAASLTDAGKYQFLRYRLSIADSSLFDRLCAGVMNENYKAQAILDFSKKYFEAGEIVPAIRYYQQIAGLKLTNGNLYEEVRHFELRLLA